MKSKSVVGKTWEKREKKAVLWEKL